MRGLWNEGDDQETGFRGSCTPKGSTSRRGNHRRGATFRQGLSVGGEEPLARPPVSDSNLYGAGTTRAVPLVGGTVTVHVNPLVDATTGELDAEKWARLGHGRRGLAQLRVARQIESFFCHIETYHALERQRRAGARIFYRRKYSTEKIDSCRQENCEVLMWQAESQALSETPLVGNRGFWHFCGRHSESSESACYFAVPLLLPPSSRSAPVFPRSGG